MSRGSSRIVYLSVCFFIVSLFTRIGLALYSGEPFGIGEWAQFICLGIIFDLSVLVWFLLPWAVYDLIVPQFKEGHWASKWESYWAIAWAAVYLAIFMIVAVSEFVFWGEFASRFDFIAADYLLYTHEVIGNIRQSYPVGLWLGTVLVICVIISWFGYRRFSGTAPASLIRRVAYLAAISIGVFVSFGLVDVQITKKTDNFFVQQLSLNGLFALGHAYRHNQLDYAQYYPVHADDELNTQVRKLLKQSNTSFNGSNGIERAVKSYVPAKDVNVVLISVESLSADFLAHFGNTQNITPELDRLADQGLLFSNMNI